jgi:predicted RNase H-like HicB family nuclease
MVTDRLISFSGHSSEIRTVFPLLVRPSKIEKEEDWVVATCLENNIASQGKTIDDAIINLKEAITLYYEDETNREN